MTKKTSKTKALSPTDIIKDLDSIIPESVITAVNNLLKEKYRGHSVTLKQKEIVSAIIKLDPTLKRDKIFDNNYLDFEPIFAKAGWTVKYNSPDRDESFEEYFEFTPKK